MANEIIIPGSLCARLIANGIITEAQLAEALEVQKTNRQLIGTILTQFRWLKHI